MLGIKKSWKCCKDKAVEKKCSLLQVACNHEKCKPNVNRN